MTVFRDERSEEYPRYSKRVVERYAVTGLERGLEFLDLVYALDPDFAELLSQYVRGGMYSREVVPQSTREICACAALAATDKQGQLRAHLRDGLAHGATREQLLEAVLQSVTYGGFPAVVSSIQTYAEVFPEMVKRDRPTLPATPGERPGGRRDPLAVETGNKLYGEEYASAIFERYDRWDPEFSLHALPQLETHIRVGFRLGLPRAQMQEIILQMTVYCGYPYVMQAMASFERVAAEVE